MSGRGSRAWVVACAVGNFVFAQPTMAHSASDAYLSLTAARTIGIGGGGHTVLEGQWDVALRDLDFVMGLDEDGDGRLTWKEVRAQRAAIERYVYPHLRFAAHAGAQAGVQCTVHPMRMQIDEHADGAYAALFFAVTCAAPASRLQLDYDLFFAIDPSHRGIYVMHNGDDVATAVLAPDHARIDIIL